MVSDASSMYFTVISHSIIVTPKIQACHFTNYTYLIDSK